MDSRTTNIYSGISIKEVMVSQVNRKELDKKIKKHLYSIKKVRHELSKIIVGQDAIINGFLRGVISNGHILVEGVPGIAKTLTVRALSAIMACRFSRIQFTPDLLPTDIIGLTTYEKERGFYVLKGPIFSNFVIADEINRAPPKVQSALLEAMAEHQATIGKETFSLPFPFFVLATQNPIETLGTYPLPEAQLDRFLFKLNIVYPNMDEEQVILKRNINLGKFEDFNLKPILSPEGIFELQEDAKKIYLDRKIERYIVRIIDASRNPLKYNIKVGKYVDWGASPRASIGMFIAAKATALLKGSSFVTPHYVKEVAPDILRHRILINYEGQSEGITTDQIITEILSKVPVP